MADKTSREFEAQYRKGDQLPWISYPASRSTILSVALAHEKWLHDNAAVETRLVVREHNRDWECLHITW